MPAIADLEGETWHAIEPGGDTICSRGQPWAFFFRPGVVNKLVVEFQGGGACWNYPTCSVADMIFKIIGVSSAQRSFFQSIAER